MSDVIDKLAEKANLGADAKEKLTELAKQGVVNKPHYRVQKSCSICKVREEAIMYADSEEKLGKFLSDQTKARKHPHKVNIKIEPLPLGSATFTDFYRIAY